MSEKTLKIVKLNTQYDVIPPNIPFVLENFKIKNGFYTDGIISFPKNFLSKSSKEEVENCKYHNFFSIFSNDKKLLYSFGDGIIRILNCSSYFVINPTGNCQLGMISNFESLVYRKEFSEIEEILGVLFNYKKLILIDINEDLYNDAPFLSKYIYEKFPYKSTNNSDMILLLLKGSLLKIKYKKYNYLNFLRIFDKNEKITD